MRLVLMQSAHARGFDLVKDKKVARLKTSLYIKACGVVWQSRNPHEKYRAP